MRRLGERAEYGKYLNTLGRAVHSDFHTPAFLPPVLMDEREKRTSALPEIERVLAAWRHLPEWEPGGEILYRVLGVDCLALTPALGRRGFRHHDKLYWRQRAEAWEIVGALVVDVDVLAAAEAAGAVDARTLTWARARR